jgi:hypothetical protein
LDVDGNRSLIWNIEDSEDDNTEAMLAALTYACVVITLLYCYFLYLVVTGLKRIRET